MADAWGGSWGSSWGISWGSGVAPPPIRRGDDAPARRRPVFVYEESPPEPVVAPARARKPKRRRVTKEAVQAALSVPWAGLWTYDEAIAALPTIVPVNFETSGMASDEQVATAIAVWLANEAARREDEDLELLLLSN